jgi:hypothetical protein
MIDPRHLLAGNQLSMSFWEEYHPFFDEHRLPAVASLGSMKKYLPYRVSVVAGAFPCGDWLGEHTTGAWYETFGSLTQGFGAKVKIITRYNFEEETDALAFHMKVDGSWME